MLIRFRWPLLILALLFVLGGSYVIRLKTGAGSPDPGTRAIMPIQPPPSFQRGAH